MEQIGYYWAVVILPVLIGSVSIAFVNIIKRYVMKGGEVSSLQFLINYFYAATLLFAAIYLALWGPNLPPRLLDGFWRAVIFGSIANVIIQYLNVKAASLDKGEVTLTAPLQAMTPGLITILAVVLGELPSQIGIFGIILMASGSYVLLFEKAPSGLYELVGPFGRLKLFISRSSSKEERNKALVVLLALGSAFMGTFGLLFDGLFTRRGVDMQGLTLASMSLTAFLATSYFVWYQLAPDAEPHQNPKGFRVLISKFRWALLAIGIGWVIHVFMIWPTYNTAYVAHIGTLKRFHILISFVLGLYLLKEAGFKKGFWYSVRYEPEVRNRAIASALIIFGALFLSMDKLPSRIETRIVGWGL